LRQTAFENLIKFVRGCLFYFVCCMPGFRLLRWLTGLCCMGVVASTNALEPFPLQDTVAVARGAVLAAEV
jgi:hypothetical protein